MIERFRHHELEKSPLRRNGSFRKSDFLKRLERQEWREAHPYRHTFKKVMGRAALIGAGAAIIGGQVNIALNKQLQADSNVDISIRYDAIDEANDDHATVIMGGYGYRNADFLADQIGPALQTQFDGQVWSVDYNDASLDANAIAQEIIETADEQDVNFITLLGHSIGGVTASQVNEVLSDQTDVRVQATIPFSAPNGYDGLREWKQDQMDFTWLLNAFPDLVYSTPFQVATETVFRYEQYKDGSVTENVIGFFETLTSVIEKINNRELPGNWLISDQVLTLQNARMQERFNNIGEHSSNTLEPIIIYIGTTGFDISVDDEKSAEALREYAEQAGLVFIHITVDGLTHDRPWRAADELATALADSSTEIQSALAENQMLYNMQNVQIFFRVR